MNAKTANNTAPRASHGPRGAFSPLVMLALVVVGVFAFSAFFTLTAFAPELRTGHDGRAHALSQSAVGYAGFIKLAQARGERIDVSRTDRRGDPPTVTVITPERTLTEEDLRNVGGQTLLVVLPKWLAMPHPVHPGWVSRLGAAPEAEIAELLGPLQQKAQITRATGAGRPLLRLALIEDEKLFSQDVQAGAISQLQTIDAPGIEPVATDAAGHIVLGRLADYQNREVYVLADPDFLNTQGVADIDNARAGFALIDAVRKPFDGEVTFDVTLNGFTRARSVLRMAFEPPFLPATLCLFAAACLLGWRAALRAGPSVAAARAIALGKSALADNSAALIHMAGREARMGAGYAALTGASVVELIGAPRQTEEENAALLDAVGQAQGVSHRFSQLATEAELATTPSKMLEAAKKLHAWKEEMLRATG